MQIKTGLAVNDLQAKTTDPDVLAALAELDQRRVADAASDRAAQRDTLLAANNDRVNAVQASILAAFEADGDMPADLAAVDAILAAPLPPVPEPPQQEQPS